ncbi:MAG: adenylyltransferase/cytidyltransferase family protein [Nitrospira sp.]|nr:adenylyltransferase/cytidyltransferase family protein [Nitrospira sp.]
MKLGLFGGTFNPVHFGHLRAAQELAEILKLDRVVFIPAATPPHKENGGIVSFEHRLRMLQLAVDIARIITPEIGQGHDVAVCQGVSRRCQDRGVAQCNGRDRFGSAGSGPHFDFCSLRFNSHAAFPPSFYSSCHVEKSMMIL